MSGRPWLLAAGLVIAAVAGGMLVTSASATPSARAVETPTVMLRIPLPQPGNYSLQQVTIDYRRAAAKARLKEIGLQLHRHMDGLLYRQLAVSNRKQLSSSTVGAAGVTSGSKNGEYAAIFLVGLIAPEKLPPGHPKVVEVAVPALKVQGETLVPRVIRHAWLPNVLKRSTDEVAKPRKLDRFCEDLYTNARYRAKYVTPSLRQMGRPAGKALRQACNEATIPAMAKVWRQTGPSEIFIADTQVSVSHGPIEKINGVDQAVICANVETAAGATVEISYTLPGSTSPLTTQKAVAKTGKLNGRTNVPVETSPPGYAVGVDVRASKGGESKAVKKSVKVTAGSASASCTIP